MSSKEGYVSSSWLLSYCLPGLLTSSMQDKLMERSPVTSKPHVRSVWWQKAKRLSWLYRSVHFLNEPTRNWGMMHEGGTDQVWGAQRERGRGKLYVKDKQAFPWLITVVSSEQRDKGIFENYSLQSSNTSPDPTMRHNLEGWGLEHTINAVKKTKTQTTYSEKNTLFGPL